MSSLLLSGCSNGTSNSPDASAGIHKIKHVVIIMQENRSFDSYFGTVPGADGIALKNVDHQTLSFDAYLKFIEDDFLGGQRLDPKSDGRLDTRPTVREVVAKLGDLIEDFGFSQKPREPLILEAKPASAAATP